LTNIFTHLKSKVNEGGVKWEVWFDSGKFGKNLPKIKKAGRSNPTL
jgi:hypothetical protein